ncbi:MULTISPECIES: hypothetical protein [unclassified Sedimentibacter]|uniref:hypothetical protein n=1 Tax=unclassified Sedimentibacter TaxID=2649220 RepID=UPI0027E19D56|nr:hypothetical protein [Sedimentibacter sp. MB35-C1]WMJ77654.1 hypothetical protein RBQ61_01640 [Sedimentibacter sp. MB35-C1]
MFNLDNVLFMAFIYLSPILFALSIIPFVMSVILRIKSGRYKKILKAGFIFLIISFFIFIIPAVVIGVVGVVPE